MALTFTDRGIIAADVRLAELRYLASIEGCDCPTCQIFDRQFDADIIAADHRGRPVLIAYRRQTNYDKPTITTRLTTDRGSSESQVKKILTGKSLATVHLQSYPTRIVIARASDLRSALRQAPLLRCREHPRDDILGDGGQTFLARCPECMTCRVIMRHPMAVSA